MPNLEQWVYDFVEYFDEADHSDGKMPHCRISSHERLVSGKAEKRGILQHPPLPKCGACSLRYPPILIPACVQELRLDFFIGILDELPTGEQQEKFSGELLNWDGVQFAVRVNGKRVKERTLRSVGWVHHTLPIDKSDAELTVEFITNALQYIEFNWAAWGEPQLIGVCTDPGSSSLDGGSAYSMAPVSQEENVSGVLPALHSRLRTTLIDCEPFRSDQLLRAVFVHSKLLPWQPSVPEASSVAERVDTTIAFLINRHRSDTGENALVLLLRVLSGLLDSGDALHHRLSALAVDLENALAGDQTTSPSLPSVSVSGSQPPAFDAELTAEVQELVRQDQIAEALTRLSSLEPCRHEASLLSGRLSRLRVRERQGTITRSDADAERTKIAEAILDLISM